MIVITIIAAVCTGAVCGAGIGEAFDLPEFAKIIIMVFAAFVTEFGILAYTGRERDKGFDSAEKMYKKIVDIYKDQDKENAEMFEACCRDLKKADIDCQFCKHSNDPELGKKCLDSDCSCEECGADCPCRGCRSNSNYKWRGVCDDNDTEE